MNYEDDAISYVYEIVKTVEFHLASDRTFRLEVVKVEKGTSAPHFAVRYYERDTLYKTAGGTISSEPGASTIRFDVWVPDVNLPWVNQGTAEAALSQALGWLAERRNNQNKSL